MSLTLGEAAERGVGEVYYLHPEENENLLMHAYVGNKTDDKVWIMGGEASTDNGQTWHEVDCPQGWLANANLSCVSFGDAVRGAIEKLKSEGGINHIRQKSSVKPEPIVIQ